jgi:3-methyl-2-oxobutanoate hydroxymethyltransferase
VDALTKDLKERKARGDRLAVLTAYDYPTARLMDEAGADLILVGDSLGMVVLGLPDTTGVTMTMMLHHAAAVRRAVKRATLIVDLPIHTYDLPDHALHNARRLVEAGADAVKLEGGVSRIDSVRAITSAGISYVGHIGMLPQNIKSEGAYRKKGRTPEAAAQLVEDAKALEEAGSCAIVLESVIPEVEEKITRAVKIPTISVGPSSFCDGEVLVSHDLFGLFPWFKPPFAKSRANLAQEITRAAREYITAIKGAK